MKKLNLPPFEYKIKRDRDSTKIFDIIRRKYFVLTPEEWVRQHFIHYLIEHRGYSKSLISVETGLKYNQLRKRSDIVVYNKSGFPFLLVECKSADSLITKEALFQAATYNKSVNAGFIAVTNGMSYICAKVVKDPGKMEWMDSLPEFPGEDPSS